MFYPVILTRYVHILLYDFGISNLATVLLPRFLPFRTRQAYNPPLTQIKFREKKFPNESYCLNTTLKFHSFHITYLIPTLKPNTA